MARTDPVPSTKAPLAMVVERVVVQARFSGVPLTDQSRLWTASAFTTIALEKELTVRLGHEQPSTMGGRRA